jgi:alkylation response protein AidB-like acyl-CoA dehydrogenase
MRSALNFMLFEWLGVEELTVRPRFADHSRETFSAILDVCERLAHEQFAPVNREVDAQEPRLENGRVVLPEAAYTTARAYVDSGMLSATQDAADGGMQLPHVVESAARAFFNKAGIGLGGGAMLTTSNANLLLAHGTQRQKDIFAAAEFAGRWFGTMCLSETHAGSGLADILTRATADPDGADDPLGPRYRLYGNKMWISNGDHELSENIVHLVLAKIPDANGKLPEGAAGISLFVVPKHIVDGEGQLTGERNDVAVAGLNHKLGYRGLPNALLNFGEGIHLPRGRAGAVGYLVGAPGEGLRYMFHMMNEARISVGLGAASIAYAGFEASLRYARERRQGRGLSNSGKRKTPVAVPIIEHADVKRMLLAQKAYAEGAIALSLYCARLVDEMKTGTAESASAAHMLLELLTPMAKGWPSEWGVEANSLAIQVHGGYGYTRDFPVEQYWRDNRLNMIHEGTHGIQGLDLLGRKVRANDGVGLRLLRKSVEATIEGTRTDAVLAHWGLQLTTAFDAVYQAATWAWASGNAAQALANSTLFLQAFGHSVVAWLWLDLAVAAARTGVDAEHAAGVRQSAQYFFRYELPKVSAWLEPVANRDSTCVDMQDRWFDA